jgi:hypothetical protein
VLLTAAAIPPVDPLEHADLGIAVMTGVTFGAPGGEVPEPADHGASGENADRYNRESSEHEYSEARSEAESKDCDRLVIVPLRPRELLPGRIGVRLPVVKLLQQAPELTIVVACILRPIVGLVKAHRVVHAIRGQDYPGHVIEVATNRDRMSRRIWIRFGNPVPTVQAHFRAAGDAPLEPSTLRRFGVYGGAQGVWVNSKRTQALDDRGITVGVLNTGLHYADDFTDKDVLYHYPRTNRPPGRDRSEIEATKAAGEHRIPVFVISHPTPHSSRRNVQLGWVEGWDDGSELFLITFNQDAPINLLDADRSEEEEFKLLGNNRRRKTRTVTERPSQGRFKLKVLQRYGSRCPLSGVAVPEMLDAAHLVPHSQDGTDDPRNGIPLNAALHRAFDAHLFAINPDTYEVVTKPRGPSLDELGITTPTLKLLRKLPHPDALIRRYDDWRRRQGNL